jgi:hypothetical protein
MTTNAIAPDHLWVQIFGNELSASSMDSREVHDNGKPIYEYNRVVEASPLTTVQIDALSEDAVEYARKALGWSGEFEGQHQLLSTCASNAEEDALIFELAAHIEQAVAQWIEGKRREKG